MKEKTETLHAQHGTDTPPEPARAAKGTGTTITIDLKEFPAVLEHIRKESAKDDREPSKWLRRRIVNFHAEGSL